MGNWSFILLNLQTSYFNTFKNGAKVKIKGGGSILLMYTGVRGLGFNLLFFLSVDTIREYCINDRRFGAASLYGVINTDIFVKVRVIVRTLF